MPTYSFTLGGKRYTIRSASALNDSELSSAIAEYQKGASSAPAPIDPFAKGGAIGVRPVGGGPSGNGDPLGDPADDPTQPKPPPLQRKAKKPAKGGVPDVLGQLLNRPLPKEYDPYKEADENLADTIAQSPVYKLVDPKRAAQAKARQDKKAADRKAGSAKFLAKQAKAPLEDYDFDALPFTRQDYIAALNAGTVVRHRDGRGFTELGEAQRQLVRHTGKTAAATRMTKSQSDVELQQERDEVRGHAKRAKDSMVGRFVEAQRSGDPRGALSTAGWSLVGSGVDKVFHGIGAAADVLDSGAVGNAIQNATREDGGRLTPSEKSQLMSEFGRRALATVANAGGLLGVGTDVASATKAGHAIMNAGFGADLGLAGTKAASIIADPYRSDEERAHAATELGMNAAMIAAPAVLGKIARFLPERTTRAAAEAVHALVTGSRDPAEAVARATKRWRLPKREAKTVVDAIVEGGHAGPKSAMRKVDALSDDQYGELLGKLPQSVRDTMEGQLAGGDSEGARQTLAQHLGGLGPSHEQRFEGQLHKAVQAGIVPEEQALAVADLWAERAEAWAAQGEGRTRDQFYERFAPTFAIDEAAPHGALNQYEAWKRGGDRSTASADDILQFLQGRDEMPVHFTIADRAVNGLYHNPETGAQVRLHGGPGYGLDDETYAKAAWANEGANAAKQIQKGAAQSGGLVLPYTASMDTVRGSMHGPMAFVAEAEAAIKNGTATPKQVMELLNDALDRMGEARVQSLDEFLARMRGSSFEMRKDLMKKALPKRQSVVPDWEAVQTLMTDPRLRSGEAGEVAAALYVDPTRGAALASELGVPEHPGYARAVPGVNLGGTSPVNLRELFAEDFEAMRRKIAANKGVDPALVSDGEVYPKWKYGFDRRGGNGTLNADQLAALADDGRGTRPRLGGGAEGRLADDVGDAAGALRADEPRAAGEGGPLYQRSAADGGVVKGAVSFAENERPVVHLFTGASDVSTLVHESAHIWRRSLPTEDLEILRRHFGDVGSVEAEERFARAVERYLHDGQAPTQSLVPLFERFKNWMGSIYGKVKGSAIEAEIHPEIRQVLDSMLGRAAPDAAEGLGKLTIGNVNEILARAGLPALKSTRQPWATVEAQAARLDAAIGGDVSGIVDRFSATPNSTLAPEERLILHGKAQELLNEQKAIERALQTGEMGGRSREELTRLQGEVEGQLKTVTETLYKSGSQDGRNLAFHRFILGGADGSAAMDDVALIARAERASGGRLTKAKREQLLEANDAVRTAETAAKAAADAEGAALDKVRRAAANGELSRVTFDVEALKGCPLFLGVK